MLLRLWGRPCRHVVVFPCVTTTQARVCGAWSYSLTTTRFRLTKFRVGHWSYVTASPGHNPRYPFRVRTAKSTSFETWSLLLIAHWTRSSAPDLLNEWKKNCFIAAIDSNQKTGRPVKIRDFFFKPVYLHFDFFPFVIYCFRSLFTPCCVDIWYR